MEKLKLKNKWSDVTLEQYLTIIDIANEDLDGLEKDVKILSTLYGLEENEIWSMEVEEVNRLKSSLAFVSTPPAATNKKYTTLNINGEKFNVCTDLNKFTYSQYVDFQTYYPQKNNIVEVLSTIIVPVGAKYGDYDIEDIRKKIKGLDVLTAVSICSFFLHCLTALVKSSLQSLEKEMKMMKKMRMSKEKKEKIISLHNRIMALQHIIG